MSKILSDYYYFFVRYRTIYNPNSRSISFAESECCAYVKFGVSKM